MGNRKEAMIDRKTSRKDIERHGVQKGSNDRQKDVKKGQKDKRNRKREKW